MGEEMRKRRGKVRYKPKCKKLTSSNSFSEILTNLFRHLSAEETRKHEITREYTCMYMHEYVYMCHCVVM